MTRQGQPIIRTAAVQSRPDVQEKRSNLVAVREAARSRVEAGPDGARSQDFRYDEHGLSR